MTNTNNSNSNVITSTSSPSQQLQHPQNAPQQYGRVDLSPPSSSVLSHAEAGPTTTTVAVPAPKRELNIRSWFSSSSMASSSPPVASSSASAAGGGGGLTGDLLNIEGASSRDQQQQQRPISPPSGMTPPAPSKESINFPFPSSALIYFLISHIITIYCTFIGGVIPLYSLMALYGGCTNYTV